jgi:hypothetical protein
MGPFLGPEKVPKALYFQALLPLHFALYAPHIS